MRRPEWLARQAGCPTGWLGQFLAWIMAAETAAVNEQALALLACTPTDHVLEVGCGHGRTLARTAAAVPVGFVAGVDVSGQMVHMARRHNRQLLTEGRLEVHHADSACLPYPDTRFDRTYAIHTLYFWAEPRVHLREIGRVMKAGARFVLGFIPKEDEQAVANFPASVYRFYTSDEVRRLLEESGFTEVRLVHHRSGSKAVVFGIAHRSDAATAGHEGGA